MTHRDPAIQAAVDRLNAERYGPSLWWETKPKSAAEVDADHARTVVLDLAHEDNGDQVHEVEESA